MDTRIEQEGHVARGATRAHALGAGMAGWVVRLGVAASMLSATPVWGHAQTVPTSASRPVGAAAGAARIATHATIADFQWLTGTWQGRLNGGSGRLTVVFTAPDAGLMTGTMHLVDHDKIQVVELISIVDTPQGPELRFRHFSSTLDAYESTFKQTLRLISHDVDRDVFENLVPFDKDVMSTQPRTTTFIRRGADEFVGRSDIIDQTGKPAIVEVSYHRTP